MPVRQRDEDELIGKLLHEIDMNLTVGQITDGPTVEIVNELDAICFPCGLIRWVELNAYEYALGPESCLANELGREHFCLHTVERLERRVTRREAAHRERMFRLRREVEFLRQQLAEKRAEAEWLEARLAEWEDEN